MRFNTAEFAFLIVCHDAAQREEIKNEIVTSVKGAMIYEARTEAEAGDLLRRIRVRMVYIQMNLPIDHCLAAGKRLKAIQPEAQMILITITGRKKL